MNKTILILGIATAFVVGLLSANPVVEAVGGWKQATANLDSRVSQLENQEFRMATTMDDMTFRLIGPGERVSFGLRCDDPDATAIGGGFTVTGQGPNPENIIVQELNSPRSDNSFNKYIAVIENNGLDDAVIEGFVTCGKIVKIP